MNKQEAKLKLSKARKLANSISNEYGKVSPNSKFHDALYYERQGAFSEVAEIEDEIDRDEFRYIDDALNRLEQSLKNCKLVNKAEDLISQVKFNY